MLTIQLLREQTERVKRGLAKRGFKDIELVNEAIALDEVRRNAKTKLDKVLADINQDSKAIGQLYKEGKRDEAEELRSKVVERKEEARDLEEEWKDAEKRVQDLLTLLPNIPHESVPPGAGADDNEVVKIGGPNSDSVNKGRPHWEIAADFRLIDFEVGTKITGSGFPVYIGKGAALQRALIQFFLDEAVKAGYTEYIPPLIVNEDSAFGTGQLPDKDGQMYVTREEGFFLIPTAEVPLTNIYRDTIHQATEIPKKMTGFTPCFRREAGSYGKDVRGLNRLHQFDKVEIVQITSPEKSYEVLDEMVAHVESLLQKLQLPYRILRLCGGDMGFTSALTYDFEVYSTGQDRWLEVSSVSNFETFQTNRLKIRIKREGGTVLAHSLNGSALALPRVLAALLEINDRDGQIVVPEVLSRYLTFDSI